MSVVGVTSLCAKRRCIFTMHACKGLTAVVPLYIYVVFVCVSGWEEGRRCEEIAIPMCKGIGYNHTYMPNQFNHETQEEAGLEVHQFWPLVEIMCSPDLKFFLCSMYTPICMTNYKKRLPACRSVCERAQTGCAPLMRQYGFAWPEQMNCDRLPEYGNKHQLCMDANSTERQTVATDIRYPPTIKPPVIVHPKGPPMIKPPVFVHPSDHFPHDYRDKPISQINNVFERRPKTRRCQCACTEPLVYLNTASINSFGKIQSGGIENCAMSCHSPYFTDDQKKFATFWIGIWSILCCLSTFMTVSTFFVDMQRFKYPERPIIFLSGCYLMISIGYIIRLVMGHDAVACDSGMVLYKTTGPAACTIVFLFVYFFSMASSIWWVILTFTWFLAAGLKWGQEAIASYSQYFHLTAWLIPSVMSIAVLALSSVDGDSIAGICFVGNQSLENLRGFVLIPLFFYLVIGTSFLLAGFVSLIRIRNVIKQQGRGKTDKLERLMIRIGVFTVLYTVPASIVIACYFYDQHNREIWEISKTCPCAPQHTPDFSVFMLKYFMCLVVGITSGFWIWTGKTLDSWRSVFNGMICKKNAYSHPGSRSLTKLSSSSYNPAKPYPFNNV